MLINFKLNPYFITKKKKVMMKENFIDISTATSHEKIANIKIFNISLI